MTDGVLPLLESGVIDNSQKAVMPGVTVASLALGSRRLYDYMDYRKDLVMKDVAWTNDPFRIRQNPKVMAINSAVEVDLTGQVCADSVGMRIISGVGGQHDFMYGGALSEGGKTFIAIPSTTPKGESKIRALLSPGAGVVTTRHMVQHVVTEYGAGAPAGPQPRRTRPSADSRGAPLGPRGAGTRRSRTLRLFVPAPQSIQPPGPVPEKTGRAFLPDRQIFRNHLFFAPTAAARPARSAMRPGKPGTAPRSGCGPKARNTRWPSGTQMRHNSREYAGVSLDIPIFNRRAARNDISKAQLAVRSQSSPARTDPKPCRSKYEFVFRRRFPISTAGSRCNSENGRF